MMRWTRHVRHKNAYRTFVGNLMGRLLRRSRWENNIKIVLKEISVEIWIGFI
jgi:hypothetical protein